MTTDASRLRLVQTVLDSTGVCRPAEFYHSLPGLDYAEGDDWMAVPKALRSERALTDRGPHRGRWGAGGVGTCVGAACRGFPRNPVESQRPEVVGSCSMLR